MFLKQIREFSTWLYIKINAVYLITVNWGRGVVGGEDEVFEVFRKLLDFYGVTPERMEGLPTYSSSDKFKFGLAVKNSQ